MQRRHYLAVGLTTALPTFAGCLGDSGSTDSENGDTGSPDSQNGDTGTENSSNGEDGTSETVDGGDDTTNSSDDTDDEDSDTGTRDGIAPMCEIENTIDEITVVGCESHTEGTQYVVSATVRNDGTRETSLYNYEKKAWIYESDETIGRGIDTDQSTDVSGFDMAPGDTGTITITLVIRPEDITTDDIQRYVFELDCWSATEAVYCPEP